MIAGLRRFDIFFRNLFLCVNSCQSLNENNCDGIRFDSATKLCDRFKYKTLSKDSSGAGVEVIVLAGRGTMVKGI